MDVELLPVFGSAGLQAHSTLAEFVTEELAFAAMLTVSVNVSVPLLAATGPAFVQFTTCAAALQDHPADPLT
jgi:hypothetical protein